MQYIFPDPKYSDQTTTKLLSLLATEPPTSELAIGTTSAIPPTSASFGGNRRFMELLHSVMAEHAHGDPEVVSQAQMMASSSEANNPGNVGSGNARGGGAGEMGEMGSTGRGGWIHVSDHRNPPFYGRIAEPEDIFGSLEVDGRGQFVDGHGHFQVSGTYRLVTKEGILGISPFLRGKLVQRLRLEEAALRH